MKLTKVIFCCTFLCIIYDTIKSTACVSIFWRGIIYKGLKHIYFIHDEEIAKNHSNKDKNDEMYQLFLFDMNFVFLSGNRPFHASSIVRISPTFFQNNLTE